ncbi:MAG: glutamate-1-semialdehyde 2,1-aminomutase [Syntrophomonadaceae bacterium]|nr:glutamate-1-semialdehyde 2,1-aminomutase [Syntrophomonadaceae bacterium]
MLKQPKSEILFEEAKKYIPGGVNSPVRAFKSVGLTPVFIKTAKGSKIKDVDDNEYIDYVCSWGPLILGHSHPEVIKAICDTAVKGTSYGAPCEPELELAKMICEAFPAIEMVRMVNSGTEATMSAIRLARAYTGKNKIVKFEGCYHGHADSFLIKAGSGLLTAGVPNSPGVPEAFASHTLVARYNHLDSVEKLFEESGSDIAAVIVEPIAGNMGLVLPKPEFLQGLREITNQYHSLLIFDEVITGFRLGYGGFQNRINIEPDLTTLGKIIGGGLPVGAYGGKLEIMSKVAPMGDVYQAGTLSGNPLAMAAGVATLNILRNSEWYDRLEMMTKLLVSRLKGLFDNAGKKCRINQIGSMFSVFFTDRDVVDYESVMTCDTGQYARFYRELLTGGIYFPPSQFEVCFISGAHELYDIEVTLEAVERALQGI